jgi:hypothetical protein
MFFFNKKNLKCVFCFIFFHFYFYASDCLNSEGHNNENDQKIFNSISEALSKEDNLDQLYLSLKNKNIFKENEPSICDAMNTNLNFFGGSLISDNKKLEDFKSKEIFQKLNIISKCMVLLLTKNKVQLKKTIQDPTLNNFLEITKKNSQTIMQDYLLNYFSKIISAKYILKKKNIFCFNFSDCKGNNEEFQLYDVELQQQTRLINSILEFSKNLISYDKFYFDKYLSNKSFGEFYKKMSLEKDEYLNFLIKTTNNSDQQEQLKIKNITPIVNMLSLSNAFNNNYFSNKNHYEFSNEKFESLKKEFKNATTIDYDKFFENSSKRFKNNENYDFWKMNAYLECKKNHTFININNNANTDITIKNVFKQIDNFIDCSDNEQFDKNEYAILSKFLFFLKNKHGYSSMNIFNTAISAKNNFILNLFDFDKLLLRHIVFKVFAQISPTIAKIENDGNPTQLLVTNPLDSLLNKIPNSNKISIREALRSFNDDFV